MWHGMGDVEEERLVFVSVDEIHGMLGIPGREHRLVFFGDPFDRDLAVIPERKRILAPVFRVLPGLTPKACTKGGA